MMSDVLNVKGKNLNNEELENMRKDIIEEYFKLGLVEDKRNKNGDLVLSKEELDEWEWD